MNRVSVTLGSVHRFLKLRLNRFIEPVVKFEKRPHSEKVGIGPIPTFSSVCTLLNKISEIML